MMTQEDRGYIAHKNRIKIYLTLFFLYSCSASSINQLSCNIEDSIFVKFDHEINNTQLQSQDSRFRDQTEVECFSRCHLFEECKSAQYNTLEKVCLTRNFTVTDVNTKMKHSTNTKVYHKKKCNILYDLISLVDNVVDCKDIYDQGWMKNGIYGIRNNNTYEPIVCVMSLRGGGWTVIQQRVDGSVDFYRNWKDYKNGFGHLDGNFWYGNDRIHKLTWFSSSNEIIIPLVDSKGTNYAPRYSEFKVAPESNKYKLSVGSYLDGFDGLSATNGLEYHNNQGFSTYDKHNYPGNNCVEENRGGWWYRGCQYVNLNGLYNEPSAAGITFHSILGKSNPLQKVQMLIRKK